MKIYLIGQKGIPAKSGGVEKHVEELSVRLAQAGHEVFAYVRPNYTDKDLKVYKGVNLIALPSIATKHLDAISHTFRAVVDVIRRDADIVHFHSIGPSSLLWLVKLFKPGIPVIATFHTRCYKHQKWGWFARTYLKLGEFVACTLADKTIAVSESLRDYAKKTYGRDAAYIPNGVAVEDRLEADGIRKWGLEPGKYIVAVSRLIRHKGLHHLIGAYNRLKTDKKLVIVGDGSFTDDYVKELQSMASINSNIIMTGAQSGRLLGELFSNAYLFVQPSESEGLSIALLEAMSYQRAVLVSDIPENLEAVGGSGFSFRNKDSRDLAEKIAHLLANPDLVEEKGRSGYERVKKFYDWQSITKNILLEYVESLSAKRKHSAVYRLTKRFISFLF